MRENNQAGRFRDEITIRRYTETQDGLGGIIKTWETIGKVRSFVDGAAGKEKYIGAELAAEKNYYLEFRYFDGLDEKDFILINEETVSLDIQSIIDVENKNRYHRVLAIVAANDDALP